MEASCLPGIQTEFGFSPVKCNKIQRLVAKNASYLKRPQWEEALSPSPASQPCNEVTTWSCSSSRALLGREFPEEQLLCS